METERSDVDVHETNEIDDGEHDSDVVLNGWPPTVSMDETERSDVDRVGLNDF